MGDIGIPKKLDSELIPEFDTAVLADGGIVIWIINLFILINVLMSLIFLIYAGIQLIMSGGDLGSIAKEGAKGNIGRIKTAKNAITYSIIGLVLTVLALTIVKTIEFFLGVDLRLLG